MTMRHPQMAKNGSMAAASQEAPLTRKVFFHYLEEEGRNHGKE